MFKDLEITTPDILRSTRVTGEAGERAAAQFLEQNGYRMVMANFKTVVGRNSRGAEVTGEIDLIALDGGTLCFIEVKTRRSDDFASPVAAIDLRKQRQIIRTARAYRQIFAVWAIKFRYDAVSIVMAPGDSVTIELFKDFWTESKFRKRRWHRGDHYYFH